jgi:hypothetical protein
MGEIRILGWNELPVLVCCASVVKTALLQIRCVYSIFLSESELITFAMAPTVNSQMDKKIRRVITFR